MSMKLGVPYSMSNKVIEFEPDKRIAWQTGSSGPLGSSSAGASGATSSREADGGTRSRETWDIPEDKQRFLLKRAGGQADR